MDIKYIKKEKRKNKENSLRIWKEDILRGAKMRFKRMTLKLKIERK